ncbi:solute-binding protein [Planosporangium flavigriseum]|uniref:VWFA domain-containing protein n=1 Tax=Planosporangium flavigriseum TaxID=373681 RepID=A0A8J3LVN4_9ACTN|nr:substrate-binding domain-containing protein [Planosporangium flavigriseum]NJC64533.1 solute-binding protein [Planosporangium flavigriseum]GIG71985.1 hypothetical protein Pfl04_03890 [Planosporangium flavigriseum]
MRGPLTLGAVVVLVAVTFVAFRVVSAQANGCSGSVRLSIAANPDIYPAVREAAARWVDTNPKVDNDCIHMQVNPVPAADVANALAVRAGGGALIDVAARPAPTPADDEVPAVWIPDSVSWVGRVQAIRRDVFEYDVTSVAMSPVVLAMPETLARTLSGGSSHKLTAEEFAGLLQRSLRDKEPNVQVGIAEPRRDAASLAGAVLMYDAVPTGPAQLPALIGAYRGISVVPDRAALLRVFDRSQAIAPVAEQAILAPDAASQRPPFTAVPLAAAIALDYPYAVVAGRPRAVAQAAAQFRAALMSRGYRDILTKAGFHDPGRSANQGLSIGDGGPANPVTGNSLADGKKITDVLAIWKSARTPSRIIAFTDVTAVMGQPAAPGALTRLEIMQQAQLDGLKLITDDSEVGVWTFASGLPGGKDYQEMVPVGPLDAVQRDRINLAVATNRPVATDSRGLYESVLAAYQVATDGWDESRSNMVLVCTGGGNTKPGGLSLDGVRLELEKLADPAKPIRLVVVGLGPDVNLDELATFAKTAGGKAFKAERPEEIGEIFLRALLRG